jgi:hypothetical protein
MSEMHVMNVKVARRPDASIPSQIYRLLQKLGRQLLPIQVLYYVVKVIAGKRGIHREAGYRQQCVGIYLGLANLNYPSVRGNAVLRSLQGLPY